jgi:hypothetical protein
MARKASRRVAVRLDAKGIQDLPHEDIVTILRGADDLIMSGGRNLLAKSLKGSRERRLLELGLDASPVNGAYNELPLTEVQARIDWVILNSYLDIAYDYRLPLLVYTERGWKIERETVATELLAGFDELLAQQQDDYDMTYLKDRNRGMILLLLDKVEATRDPKYIPLLQAWAEVECKTVRKRIGQVIASLSADLTQGHCGRLA